MHGPAPHLASHSPLRPHTRPAPTRIHTLSHTLRNCLSAVARRWSPARPDLVVSSGPGFVYFWFGWVVVVGGWRMRVEGVIAAQSQCLSTAWQTARPAKHAGKQPPAWLAASCWLLAAGWPNSDTSD